jgi:hypothetical protein
MASAAVGASAHMDAWTGVPLTLQACTVAKLATMVMLANFDEAETVGEYTSFRWTLQLHEFHEVLVRIAHSCATYARGT